MKIATALQMKELDRYAIETLGIPSTLLMENAAAELVREIAALLGDVRGKRAAIFCGSGNNGGDGAAAARILTMIGAEVRVLLTGDREKMTPDLTEMLRRYEEIGGRPGRVCAGKSGDGSLVRRVRCDS